MTQLVIQVARGEAAPGLVDRTIADIRAWLRDNQLRPGDVLPSETAMTERLGVSRTVAWKHSGRWRR